MGEEFLIGTKFMLEVLEFGGLGHWIKIVVILIGIVLVIVRFTSYMWNSAHRITHPNLKGHNKFKAIMIAMGYAHYTKLIHAEPDSKKKKLLLEQRHTYIEKYIVKKKKKITLFEWLSRKIDVYLPFAFRLLLTLFITIAISLPIIIIKGNVLFSDVIGMISLYVIVLYVSNFIHRYW